MAAAPTRHQDTIYKGHEEAGAYYYAHNAAHNCPRGEAAGPTKPARGGVGGGAIPALLSEGLFSGQSIQMQAVKTSILMVVMDRWWYGGGWWCGGVCGDGGGGFC
jgi:hypothetical protein